PDGRRAPGSSRRTRSGRVRPVDPVEHPRTTAGSTGAERRLAELGLELPPVATPVASYVPVVVSGSLAFVAGQVPMAEGRLLWSGKLGHDMDVDAGAEAARRC